jgi:hypothetical protein
MGRIAKESIQKEKTKKFWQGKPRSGKTARDNSACALHHMPKLEILLLLPQLSP